MIALAYLATVAVSLVVLAVALRRRPGPAPCPPAALGAGADVITELRILAAAAVRLAEHLAPAA